MRGNWNCPRVLSRLVLCAVLSLVPALLWAQGTGGRGSISGTVTDPSGAVLTGVSVTALNTGTGLTVTVATTGSGTYVIPLLPTGTYNLTFLKEGFKTESQTGMVLNADESASANVVLAVGSATEKVTVSAAAATLETESAALTESIGETAIKELPLNGRNPASLVLLAPGTTDVLKTNAGVNQTYTTHPYESGASANGGRQGSTYYLLDGSNNMDPYLLLAAPFPNADATQEFSVIGNNFDAQYGFSPGAVVSIVTKSGTNQWHGNLFEFNRNDMFSSKDYFTGAKDVLKRNQFGGSLGGAIIRDKLFIFGNYQETLAAVAGNSGSSFTPTTAMRGGDFSAICTAGFTAGLCNDPTTQIWKGPKPANGPRVPYLNNLITDPLNAGVLAILQFVPAGTNPVTGQGFIPGAVHRPDDYQYTIRADYNFNDKHRFSGHAFRDMFRQPFLNGGGNGNLWTSDRSWNTNYSNYEGTYTWTVSPSIVNQAAFSYGTQYSTSLSGQVDGQGKPICLSRFIPTMADPPGGGCAIESFPFVNGQTPSWYHRYIWNITDSVTISKGKHLIVAGVDIQRMDMNDPSGWLSEPIVGFDGGWTGNSWADVMLGQVASFEQGAGSNSTYTGSQLGIYAQDRIKVTSTLTLSAGLRYEPYLPPVPYRGRAEYFRAGQQSTVFPGAPVGMVFPGDQGIPAGGTSNRQYFSPRLGLAWAPRALPNTSIRSAFGLFTAPIDYSHFTHAGDNFPFSPTYAFSRYDPGVGSIDLNDPWANFATTGGKSPFPPFASQGPGLPVYFPPKDIVFPLPITFDYSAQKDFNLGQTASWNLSIEHQLRSNWLFRAAYVASESWHQDLVVQANPGIKNVRLLSTFSTIHQNESVGTASYQSGQFTVEKKFSNGLQFTANYTRSKIIDEGALGSIAFTGGVTNPFNIRANRGISDVNAPDVLSVNWVYQTPALKSMNAVARGVLGNWQLSGIWHAQSGLPFSVWGDQPTDPNAPNYGWNNSSGSLIGNDHADRVAGQSLNQHKGSRSQWLNQYFNLAAFVPNALNTFGSSGRNMMTGPGVNVFDIGMAKNVPFRERYNVQFRWEMFNAFNHATFGNPGADPYATNAQGYGMITGTNGNYPARVMQTALKFTF